MLTHKKDIRWQRQDFFEQFGQPKPLETKVEINFSMSEGRVIIDK